jgi:antitoxin component YwqK of YwqJK toxin-antitoxin module
MGNNETKVGDEVVCKYENGIHCYKGSKLHNLGDQPAVISDYETAWYKDGELHRTAVDKDGKTMPALIKECGYKYWYKNGVLHRNDGPAVEMDTLKKYYKDGELHRIDGPAIEFYLGKEWWLNGQRHRDERDSNGNALPAVDRYDRKEWWIHDKMFRNNGHVIECADRHYLTMVDGKLQCVKHDQQPYSGQPTRKINL